MKTWVIALKAMLILVVAACQKAPLEDSAPQETSPAEGTTYEFRGLKSGSESYKIRVPGDLETKAGPSAPVTPKDHPSIISVLFDEENRVVVGILDGNQTSEVRGPLQREASLKSAEHLVQIQCRNADCDNFKVVVTRIRDGALTEAQVKVRTRYVSINKPSPEAKEAAGVPVDPGKKLLLESAKYGLPVTETRIEVAGEAPKIQVEVRRPEVDVTGDEFSDDLAEEAQPPLQEAESSDGSKQELVITNLPPIQGEQPQPPAEAPKATPIPEFELKEAPSLPLAQEFDLPRFRNPRQEIRDPLKLNVNYTYPRIDLQDQLTPSRLLLEMAHFIMDKGIPIFQNGCNIFVRAAMTLAGYTQGRSARANDFEKVFATNNQGLREWESVNFQTSDPGAIPRLKNFMDAVPEEFGLVVQVKRHGRHGHVGILFIENSKSFVIDSSVVTSRSRGHGPRKTEVSPEKLLNTRRPDLTIYFPPGLISPDVSGVRI